METGLTETASAEEALTRRGFIGCVAGGAASMLAGCASLATHRVDAVNGVARLDLLKHPELARPGGALRVQPSGSPEPLLVMAMPAELNGAREFVVLSAICTHQGCTVDIQAQQLVCPCHGSTFDRRGQVLRGPAQRPLTPMPSAVVDGVLEIRFRGSSA
jgi:cytochrome b6-f complex iron-sulfur subunit